MTLQSKRDEAASIDLVRRGLDPGEAMAEALPGDLPSLPRAEHGETVLVVDDEPAIRILVVDVLEDLGYTAIAAADGIGGLEAMQSEMRIDLLITDVGLPGGMNGRQLADAGRGLRPDLKILFITGDAETAALRGTSIDDGIQVMTKPFGMEDLANRIHQMIGERRAAGPRWFSEPAQGRKEPF